MRWIVRTTLTMLTALMVWLILAWLAFPILGLVWNISDSLPLGIYKKLPTKINELKRGDIVVFCLTGEAANITYTRHYIPQRWLKTGCKYDLVTLMKPIAGLPGDHVEQRNNGIAINNNLLPNTKHLEKDGAGRQMPYPKIPNVIPTNQLLVLAPYNPYSWDSRYYGLISNKSVRFVVRPLLTFNYYKD